LPWSAVIALACCGENEVLLWDTGSMAPSGWLKGKWCFITGGGKGIGKAIAETFAAEGGNIALVARSKDSLEQVTGQIRACLPVRL